MSDVERELRRLAEKADRDLPATVAPRPAALRRIRLRRRVLSGGIALSVALVVAGGMGLAGDSDTDRPVPPAREDRRVDERAERCGAPFAPTYVPPGFHPTIPGRGAPAVPSVTPAQVSGGRGRHINVTLPPNRGFSLSEPARIEVLGRHALLGAIHEGYAVDFEIGRCRYQLLGYGVTRTELRDFAQGLVGTDARVGNWFGAVWPEDTLGAARRACAGGGARTNPGAVAESFAQEVLRWESTATTTSESDLVDTVEIDVEFDGYDATPEDATERKVRLSMREVLPDCWSVVSASPLPERRASTLSVGVDGALANVVFEKHGATSATVEFGFGGMTSMVHWHRGDPDPVVVHVGGRPETTGHFLVILRGADGDPFTAIGRPLPPGDFAAG